MDPGGRPAGARSCQTPGGRAADATGGSCQGSCGGRRHRPLAALGRACTIRPRQQRSCRSAPPKSNPSCSPSPAPPPLQATGPSASRRAAASATNWCAWRRLRPSRPSSFLGAAHRTAPRGSAAAARGIGCRLVPYLLAWPLSNRPSPPVPSSPLLAQVWVVVLSNLIAIQLQTLAARLGLVTGKNLAQARLRRSNTRRPNACRPAARAPARPSPAHNTPGPLAPHPSHAPTRCLPPPRCAASPTRRLCASCCGC